MIKISRMLTLFIIYLSLIEFVYPIKCLVGYGQRGRREVNSVEWERSCPKTNTCIELTTTDVTKMQQIIDYQWVSY